MKNYFLLFILITSIPHSVSGQKQKSDANIVGHVISEGVHIPFVNVAILGTTVGTVSDETGHYRISNIPEGNITLVATSIGFKSVEKKITVFANKTIEVNFELEQDVLGLEEVVISSDRNAKKRTDSPTVVSTLSYKALNQTQSVTLSEGLNFLTGLRMENNCQNCGFTQLRMNGLEGPYSQILINNRQVFSGLAGVYGLELIPSNIIERIEVVRGGGSALYGSNAIAGTVNLILKDPVSNYYEIGTSYGSIIGFEDVNPDINMNFNTSLVSDDHKTGLSAYGFTRSRNSFDANNDGFSEISSLQNTSLGSRLFHRFGYRSKLSVDFLNITEERRGGNKFEKPLHEADIAESVKHNITNTTITYDQFFRDQDLMSVYFSGQYVNRDSYYGSLQSLSGYGNTHGFTYNTGMQYKANFNTSSLVLGLENTGDQLIDNKLGYADMDNIIYENGAIIDIPHVDNLLITHQTKNTVGLFAQYDLEYKQLKLSMGSRFDHYSITNLASETSSDDKQKSGNAISPRVSVLYDFSHSFQGRISYAQGYREPQIFDEDLHIETSGSRQIIHRNDPNLTQETSHSMTSSIDFNHTIGNAYLSILTEGFYTRLLDPFANEYSSPDAEGVITYTRVNADGGATVAGVNIESDLIPSQNISLKAGFTIQKSLYDEAQEFDEVKFFRTPDNYGFLTADLKIVEKLRLSITGNYTGEMLIPHFGVDPLTASTSQLEAISNGDIIAGAVLKISDPFFDFGFKLRYTVRLNGAHLQVHGGMKNVLNAYQSDFDRGVFRDPGYMYGPVQPRMVYFGIKIGNRLNE